MNKAGLISGLITQLEERRKSIKADLEATQDSASNETKSSAGDKYETAREMAAQEINKLMARLQELDGHITQISQMTEVKPNTIVVRGSLVTTSNGILLIGPALGKVTVDETTFFVVSQQAPLGTLLMGKRVGQQASLGGKTYTILAID